MQILTASGVLLVPGTWSAFRSDQTEWWQPSGGFHGFIKQQGFQPIGEDSPWSWTTDISGISLRRSAKHVDWRHGGQSLYQYLVPPVVGPARELYVPIRDRNIIAHSHGLQPILYACADHGLKISSLISVGSPNRADMWEVAHRARPNISRWLHIYDPSLWSNRMEWLGSLFDGELKWPPRWDHQLANRNIACPRVGHSELLKNPENFHLWVDNGWFDFLKGM